MHVFKNFMRVKVKKLIESCERDMGEELNVVERSLRIYL